jgi:hypothetical protein
MASADPRKELFSMARENQSLHIVLIVFVTFTVALGATTWWLISKNNENKAALAQAEEKYRTSQDKVTSLQGDVDKLKQLITGQTGESVTDISNRRDNDIKSYAVGLNDVQAYRPLVEKLVQAIQQKDEKLKRAQEDLLAANNKLQQREKSKDNQIAEIEKKQKEASDDLVSRTQDLEKQKEEVAREKDKELEAKNQTIQQKESKITELGKKAEDLQTSLTQSLGTVKARTDEIAKLTNPVVDNPTGEIVSVDQKSARVWINLGRADSLKVLQSFAVYPSDISDLTRGKPKASIEVTQLGQHMAEARILKDDIRDPILTGDKIHTPLWKPGEKMHFALAGMMDVDGDGRSDLELVRNLISANDGVVDAYQTDRGADMGKIDGKLSLATRYVVLGEQPTEKTSPEYMNLRSKMIKEAGELGIRTITLRDLLDRMGYQRQARVISYGAGANTSDIKIRPESAQRPVSSGNVSKLFKPRQPPRGDSGGAY